MKALHLRVFILFFISLVFCNEKYIIGHSDNTPNIQKRVIESSRSFDIPGVGFIQYAESFISTGEYLGEKDGFHIIKNIMTEMETDNRLAGLDIENYYWIAMNNIPCFVYINSDGFSEYVEPVEKKYGYLKEAFERSYLNDLHNWLCPFGLESNNKSPISVGESWERSWDSVAIFINEVSPESWTFGKTKFTLDKVKKKKGRNIAYISGMAEITVDMRAVVEFSNLGSSEFIDGVSHGFFESTHKWDLDRGVEIYQKETGYLEGDYEMGDKKFTTRIHFYIFQKMIK